LHFVSALSTQRPGRFRDLRKIAVLLLSALAALMLPFTSARAKISSIVIDAESGRVVTESHADRQHHPASLAKMMTLYLAFDAVSKGKTALSQPFRVSRYAAVREPTKLGLRAGERVSLKDLILGLVTQSANDAAVVIAEGLAGSEKAFAKRMTQKAHELGMTQTVFRNASGLPDPGAWTSARDMARLAQALLRDFPAHYRYFSTETFSYRGRTYSNHNHLLGEYPGLDGIKTGYTRAAGFHLAASAKRGERRLIAVVLGDSTWVDRDRRMVGLLNSAFAQAPLDAPNGPVLHVVKSALDKTASLSPIASAEAASTPPGEARIEAGAVSGRWSVQVGAFTRRQAAEERAEQVIALEERLTAANGSITESQRRGKTLYLVRFGNLTHAGAAAVCRSLRRHHQDCYASAALR